MASVYPSTQWTEVKRFEIPCFAASDVLRGAVVRLASSGDWAVQMVASTNEQPLGIARDNAQAGEAVSVFDNGNIKRIDTAGFGVGASFPRQSYVGIVGTSTAVHPESGATVTFGLIGQVTGQVTNASTSAAVGGPSAPVWAVGQAFESAAVGDFAAVRIDPRQLTGLTL